MWFTGYWGSEKNPFTRKNSISSQLVRGHLEGFQQPDPYGTTLITTVNSSCIRVLGWPSKRFFLGGFDYKNVERFTFAPVPHVFRKYPRAISYPPISHGQILPNLWSLPGEGGPRRVHTPKQRKKRTAGTKPSFGSMGFVVWIFLVWATTLPETNSKFAPENGWLEY